MKTSQIDLQDKTHKEMKDLAYIQRITIKSFIIQAIKEKIERDTKQRERI